MIIEIEWREVPEGFAGFQLSPPLGKEYDLWYRMGPVHISGDIYSLPTEWRRVDIQVTDSPA